MRLSAAKLLLPVLATTLSAASILALDCPPKQRDDLQLGLYEQAVRECQASGQLTLARRAQEESIDITRQLAALPHPIQPASGLAAQARDSLTSFAAPFLLGADNLVTSEDGSALTLRLNPIRNAQFGSLGISVGFQEAEPQDEILKGVDEARRAALAEILGDRFDDFDDLVVEAEYGFEREIPDDVLMGSGRPLLFGRNHKRYKRFLERQLLPELLDRKQRFEAGIDQIACATKAGQWAEREGVEFGGLGDLTFDELRQALEADYGPCLQARAEEQNWIDELDIQGDALSLLPFLIDNQPQITGTYTWLRRDEWVGQEEQQAELSVEIGFSNLNTLIGKIRGGLDPWDALTSLREARTRGENRLTVGLKWTERDALTLQESFGEEDSFTVNVALPESEEWCGKLQYSRLATWNPLQIQSETSYPRFHVAAEYFEVSGDPTREEDRIVAKATYEFPITAYATVPLSLVYADKPEFLGDPDQQFSTHLGLSYSIPWGKLNATGDD